MNTTQRVTVSHSIRFSDDPEFFWRDEEYGEIRVSFGPEVCGSIWGVSSTAKEIPPTYSMLVMLALAGEAQDVFIMSKRGASILPSPHKMYRASIESLRNHVFEQVPLHTAGEWREAFAYIMRWGSRSGKSYVLGLMPQIIRSAGVAV